MDKKLGKLEKKLGALDKKLDALEKSWVHWKKMGPLEDKKVWVHLTSIGDCARPVEHSPPQPWSV